MLFIAVAVSALSLNAQTVYVPNGTSGIGGSLNGNVGVGTTNPKAMLDLKANSLSELSGTDLDFIGSNLVLTGADAGRAVGKGSSLTFAFPANTDGSNIWEQARILATPDNGNSYNACGRLYLQVRDSYNPGIGGSWNWRTGLMIQANGNVGIGTTAPDQKLTVKGKIHAEEVIVDLNVPLADYVFGKDYELMPLHQVDQYVQENSHLPDMPSATEVKEKGMGVGEMQNKMLQKIEELTLYVIQQDKRIKALEEENQRLKK